MTMGNLEWPQGHSRGGGGGGGRRGDWGPVLNTHHIPAQEPTSIEALQKHLRVDVTSPVSYHTSTGSTCCTCNMQTWNECKTLLMFLLTTSSVIETSDSEAASKPAWKAKCRFGVDIKHRQSDGSVPTSAARKKQMTQKDEVFDGVESVMTHSNTVLCQLGTMCMQTLASSLCQAHAQHTVLERPQQTASMAQ